MNLFETYTGADFLAFYAVMLATCVGLGLWIPANLRPQGRKGSLEDPEEIALLSGGAQRHALTVLADLYVQGAIEKSKKAKVSVTRTQVDTSSAGAAVLVKVGDFSLSETMRSLRDHASQIEKRLIKRGLMMNSGDVMKLRLWSIAPYAALILVGFYRQQAGKELGEPTGFLIALLLATAIFAAIRASTMNPRTMAGNLVLKNWRERSSRLKRAPEGGEVPLAVGLFGTGVLAGTPFAHVHAMRQAASGGDSGSGDSDGGGGGCGGGCGGCGG
ncbi:MAG: TIGR04222 domain-containing membrane protein [Pseudomonadota bacterium]